MKLKCWLFEFDFQKDDAKIVIPITLLLISIIFLGNKNETINEILIIGIAIYYLCFFFLQSNFEKLRRLCINIKQKANSKLKGSGVIEQNLTVKSFIGVLNVNNTL